MQGVGRIFKTYILYNSGTGTLGLVQVPAWKYTLSQSEIQNKIDKGVMGTACHSDWKFFP